VLNALHPGGVLPVLAKTVGVAPPLVTTIFGDIALPWIPRFHP